MEEQVPHEIYEIFEAELVDLINRFGLERMCNCPDFLLAEHLMSALRALANTTNSRDGWYGVHLEPARSHFIDKTGI